MELTSINKSSVVKPEDIKTQYLTENEVCGCCSGEDFTVLTSLYDEPKINYIRCSKCGAVTFDRIYSDEGISSLYDPEVYYDDYSEKGNSNITFYGSERIAKHIVRLSGKKLTHKDKETLSILDFGGGSGEIAYAVAKEILKKHQFKKIEILVVDYEQKLYCENDSVISMKQEFPVFSVNNKNFDLIIASAVIEHLPDAGAVMRKLFELTKSGGLLYFRTPYVFPLFKLMKKLKIRLNTGFPAHIWDLGKDWWDNAPVHSDYNKGDIRVIKSKPSIVEKSFKSEPLGAVAAHLMKAVWYIFRRWPFVGGWEAVLEKE